MPKTRIAKRPKTSKKPRTETERFQRMGKPSPFKSTYKRKKKPKV